MEEVDAVLAVIGSPTEKRTDFVWIWICVFRGKNAGLFGDVFVVSVPKLRERGAAEAEEVFVFMDEKLGKNLSDDRASPDFREGFWFHGRIILQRLLR